MLFSQDEIHDTSTLDVAILDDWHADFHDGSTRQKLIEITVCEWWQKMSYRAPVRLIVPAEQKATGFHITGDHSYEEISRDVVLDDLDAELIFRGTGVVHTVIKPLPESPQGKAIEKSMFERLLETRNPRYTPFWIWPMSLMRAVTAACAETDYFTAGKVAASGESKNGAAPVAAIIHDERFTAICAIHAPAYLSPLRVGNQDALEVVAQADARFAADAKAGKIGSEYHPPEWYIECAGYGAQLGMHARALSAGWSDSEYERFALEMLNSIVASPSWDALEKRGVDILFQPGTHDWVAYDILWGARHHPHIPMYYCANDGHGQTSHPAAENLSANCAAFILNHFHDSPGELPGTATTRWAREERALEVTVEFTNGPFPSNGRIWWIFDRDPGGSAGYLYERIPDDQWCDMERSADGARFAARIDLEPDATTIEFFSNHGTELSGRTCYRSSPYTRVELSG